MGNSIGSKVNNEEIIKEAYINGLVYTTRQTSVPQIFICGKHVGGYTELNNLHKAKKLFDAIDECSNQYDPIP
uniref:Glutaredoxin n=1 Tax=Panagrolaimus superbus TaxID=310955 RepID=A0A914Y206_9BILA